MRWQLAFFDVDGRRVGYPAETEEHRALRWRTRGGSREPVVVTRFTFNPGEPVIDMSTERSREAWRGATAPGAMFGPGGAGRLE